jgi:hypothetical protein
MDETSLWSTVYRKDGGVISRHVAGESLLVPVRGNLADLQRIFTLNDVGEFIWNALDGSHDLGKIRTDVTQEFEVTSSQAGEDIIEFITSLEEEGLVRRQ